MSRKNNEIALVLENIRSVHNVGAIFRTAEAAGVSKIYLAGYTPSPVDRFGRERADFKKSALGAEKLVLWEGIENASAIISKLKTENYYVVAIEQDKKAIDYKRIMPKNKTALVFGNEVEGLSGSTLDLCDEIAEIPMRGKKESLNVSVSVGVALYRIFDR